MVSTAEKSSKNTSIASKQANTSTPFFTKSEESGFFGAERTESFFGPAIQPKLSISQPDDPYEKEADQVAETVMRMSEPAGLNPISKEDEKLQLKEEDYQAHEIHTEGETHLISAVQCKSSGGVRTELRGGISRQADESMDTSPADSYLSRKGELLHQSDVIQRSGRGPPQSSETFENKLSSSAGAGSALPHETLNFMGRRFNADFGSVRIHTGSTAEVLSNTIHAQAFTHGNDIYFNSGKYSPNTAAGGLLLAHELTHTVQQGATRVNDTPAVARKSIIQRSSAGGGSVPQLDNAVAKAKGEEGKVNAGKEGSDGFREGWPRLVEYFKTTFGEDKIVSGNNGTAVAGTVSETDIKKKRQALGMRPNQERPSTQDREMRDAMPSWCGIFVFWALNKGGIPMKKWELGGRMVTREAVRVPGEMPQVGDIAYRNEFSHFAIVEKVSGNTVTTVNGNTSGEDNLGAQVQTRDHPLSGWTAFFDPIKLKTGSLQSAESSAQTEENPKTLRELRKELFNIDRKEETYDTDLDDPFTSDQKADLQTKPELSNWSVTAKGNLHQSEDTKDTSEEIQLKEDEYVESQPFSGQVEQQLRRKPDTCLYEMPLCNSVAAVQANSDIQCQLALSLESTSARTPIIQKQEEASENDRGPPVLQQATTPSVQCSWFDDAFSSVTSFVADTLEAGKRLFLNEARDFVMAIPGYRALRVILGEDPITGEEIDQNGHTFIEAAFDIMPGGRLLHQKLNELGALNDAAVWVDQQIVTVHSLVRGVISRVTNFIAGLSMERLASPRTLFEEAGNIIYSTIQSVVSFAVTAARELLETVKRFLLTQIVEFIRNSTPAYPLLRVILGQDPITDEQVDRNGTNILNALLELGGEEGIAQRTQMQETGTFQKAAEWIDRGIGVFSDAYNQIKSGFNNIWTAVTIDSLMHPVDTFNMIFEQFAAPVRQVWDFVIEAARAILNLIKEVLMRRLSAWARTVRGYSLVTVIIERDPFTDEVVPRTMENLIKGFMGLMEGGEEQYNQLKESGAIERTTVRIEAAVRRLNMTPAYIVQLFVSLWNSFSLNDLAQPVQAFERILAQFGEPIGRLIAFVVEIIRIVIEVILQVMNFPTALIGNIIAKAMVAFEMIKADPVGFLKNLLRAIKQGFIQFFDNILQHLLTGLTGWLLSELQDAGVRAPQDFSLRGIISWVLEVLGISMERIWEKLTAHPRIGPERVARIRSMISTLEGIWTFIRDVQERGIAAIWDKIQEQLTNLWDTVLGAIKSWVMDQIVNRIVTRLLSMLDPTGIMAVVNSAIALYSAIQSFVRYLREMLEIVNSFVEGVVEIASGNVTRAANFLEGALSRSMPVIIGFLANQVGLSGVGRRIGEMIEVARQLVDDALTWLVNRAVDTGFAIFDRLMSMGRAAVGAVLGWLGIRKEFTATNGESHELYFEGDTEETAEMWVASRNPMRFSVFLTNVGGVDGSTDTVKAAKKQEALVKLEEIRVAKRQPLQVGVPEEQARATKSDVINGKVTELSVPTAHLFGGPVRPLEITYGGTNSAGFATSMTIRNLNKNNRPPTGGPPRVSNLFYRKLDLRRNGDTTYYIKGHLLNGYLGGSGSDFRNLTPLSRTGNGNHERDVEALVIAQVDAGKTVEYSVTPGAGSPRTVADTDLQTAGVPQAKWGTLREIISAEGFVPGGLTCTANILNDSTGAVESSIVSITIPNPIDLNLPNYET